VKDLIYLYSSFDGRLSRRLFWQACIALLSAELVLTAALARVAGLSMRDFAYADSRARWILLAVVAFFFWPSLALCIKRLHDRDLPGWWAGLLHVLVFVFYADQAAMRLLIRDKATQVVALLPAMMLFLIGSWLLIELVFLAGTNEDNQYGPRPDGQISQPPELSTRTTPPHPGE
jgi:uncharacterized membrane protein YhaH (DUF805 family)